MPTCCKCGITQATAEMRRSPKRGESGATLWLCKAGVRCAERRKIARIQEKARRRSSQD